MQALKIYFITACDDGALGRKRARADGAAAPPPQQHDPQQEPHQQPDRGGGGSAPAASRQLQGDYSAFVARLLRLLAGPASPGLQVAALMALMECARHEDGPGQLSARLVEAVVNSAVRGAAPAPEALSLLFSRYLPHLDVRYHSLRAAARAARRVGGGGSGAGEGGEEEGAEADAAAGGGAQAGGAQAAAPDAARALFDLLAHAAPVRPGDDLSQATSWCGAAEVGGSAAAAAALAGAAPRVSRLTGSGSRIAGARVCQCLWRRPYRGPYRWLQPVRTRVPTART